MDFVTSSVEEHIATVVLDNPPVNATNDLVCEQIRDTFLALGADQDVRVAIFTGAGRTFSAGADLKSRDDPKSSSCTVGSLLDRGRAFRDASWAIYDCAVPVIGTINGPAIGGGVALAAVCDIIIASDSAWFQAAEINVGLLGAISQLSMLVGRHKARELYLTGERIDAAELYRLGAIRAIVPDNDLMRTARELATQLAQKSPIATRLAKESMNRTEFLPLKDAYRMEQDYTTRLMTFEDSLEARRAFLEKRTPDWKWR